MVSVVLTFDDGRSDNFLTAKPIMDKYGFCGTVYITTGFVDGTWQEQSVLDSPTEPLNVEQIRDLQCSGWEIGLHGDKHQTDVSDMGTALKKLNLWGLSTEKMGCSVPNSKVEEREIQRIYGSDYGDKIAYIRRGRNRDTKKLSSRVLYGLYTYGHIQSAYDRFNRVNVLKLPVKKTDCIPSVVVRKEDDPDQIIRFIKGMQRNTAIVLMLHSVLEDTHPACNKSAWCWSASGFERLCAQLKRLCDSGEAEVVTLMDLVNKQEKSG